MTEYIKVDEVAKMFDVDKQTVRIWLRTGVLKGIKIGTGHYWRIPTTEVERLATAKYGMESQND